MVGTDNFTLGNNSSDSYKFTNADYDNGYTKLSVSVGGSQKSALSTDESRVNNAELERIYKRIPLVFNAINSISNFSIANGYHYESDNETIKKGADDFDTKVGLKFVLQTVVRHTHIYGNSYVEIIYDKYVEGEGEFEGVEIPAEGAIPVNLAIIDPKTMDFMRDTFGFIKLNDDGSIVGYVQKDPKDGTDIKLHPNQVMHFMINGVADTIEGMGVIEPMYTTLTVHVNLEAALGESIYRHGYPQFHVKIGDEKHQPTTPRIEAEKVTYESFSQKSTFVTPYYHDIKILESGVLREASDYLDYFTDIIVSTTGVPKSVLGIRGKSGWDTNSTEQQNFIINMQSIQERLSEQLEKELWSRLFGEGLINMVFDPITPDSEETLKARAERHKIYYEIGVLSIQEIREEMGLERERLPNDDYYTQPEDPGFGTGTSATGEPTTKTPAKKSDKKPKPTPDLPGKTDKPKETEKQAESDPIRKTVARGSTGLADTVPSEDYDPSIKIPVTSDEQAYADDLEDWFALARTKAVPKVRKSLAQLELKTNINLDWVDGINLDEDYLKQINFENMKLNYIIGMEVAQEKFPKGIRVPAVPDKAALAFMDTYSAKISSDITAQTRTQIRNAVRDGIEAGEGLSQIKGRVSDVFGKGGKVTFPKETIQYHNKPEEWVKGNKYTTKALPERTRFMDAGKRNMRIARTEVRRATQSGRLATYQKAGFKLVQYSVSGLHNVVDICDQWEGYTMKTVDAFGEGGDYEGIIPQHPMCQCFWQVVTSSLNINDSEINKMMKELNDKREKEVLQR